MGLLNNHLKTSHPSFYAYSRWISPEFHPPFYSPIPLAFQKSFSSVFINFSKIFDMGITVIGF